MINLEDATGTACGVLTPVVYMGFERLARQITKAFRPEVTAEEAYNHCIPSNIQDAINVLAQVGGIPYYNPTHTIMGRLTTDVSELQEVVYTFAISGDYIVPSWATSAATCWRINSPINDRLREPTLHIIEWTGRLRLALTVFEVLNSHLKNDGIMAMRYHLEWLPYVLQLGKRLIDSPPSAPWQFNKDKKAAFNGFVRSMKSKYHKLLPELEPQPGFRHYSSVPDTVRPFLPGLARAMATTKLLPQRDVKTTFKEIWMPHLWHSSAGVMPFPSFSPDYFGIRKY